MAEFPVCIVSTESLLVGDVDDVAKPHFVVSIPQIFTIIYTERQLDPGSYNLNLYTQGRTFLSSTSYGGGFAALWRYQDRSSQEYITPGCQVLGGHEKLGTLPDMISSLGSHFAVLDHVKII
jgi:hypothetical protein